MKHFSLRLFLFSLVALFCTIDAWGYAKSTLTISANGEGTVAVTTSNSAPALSAYKSSSEQSQETGGFTTTSGTHTYYVWCSAATGYHLANLTGTDLTISGSGTPYTVSVAAKARTLNKKYTGTVTFAANTYSVRFNGNGSSSGSMSNQSFTYNQSENLSVNAFQKKDTILYDAAGGDCPVPSHQVNVAFSGWATSSTGGKLYNDEQSVSNLSATNNDVVDLYAVWGEATAIELPFATRTGYVLEGWYNGGSKVGNPGENYVAPGNVTLTANWTSKFTPEFIGANYNLLVDDVQTDAFTFTRVPSPVVHISDETVISYSDGAITALKEGSATIYFTQAATDEVNAGTSETYTITVAKHEPVFTQLTNNTVVGRAIALVDFVSSTNMTTAMTLSNTDGKANVAGNVIYSTQAASVEVVVSQAENYYWAAKNETFTLTVDETEPTCFVGETPANGTPYYVYSPSAKKYLSDDNTLAALPQVTWTTSFTASGTEKTGTMVSADGKYLGINRSGESKSSLDPEQFTAYSNGSLQSAATNTTTLWVKTQTDNQYSFNCNLVYKDAAFLSSEKKGDVYIKANDSALGTTTQANANPAGYWMFVSEAQAAFQVTIAKAYSYLSEKTVSAAVKNMLVSTINANSCEADGRYPTKTAALETALDVYDAYDEVHTFITNSLADQAGKDAAFAELDNNRITRDALEEVKLMIKRTAFVTFDEEMTIYVGDELPDFFSFTDCSPFGALFSANTPVNVTIDSYNTSSPTPGVVFTYDSESNTLRACNAGKATITFTQAETADYYFKQIACTITIVKRTPDLTFCTSSSRVFFDHRYPNFVASTNTDCDFSVLTSSNPSVATIVQRAQGYATLVVAHLDATCTVNVAQPETYKFLASGEQSITFTPREVNDHVAFTLKQSNYEDFAYNHVSSGGFSWTSGGILLGVSNVLTFTEDLNYNDRYVDIQFSGIADKLSFSYERSVSIATGCDWYVKESADGDNWTEVSSWTSNNGTKSNLQLLPTSHYLRLCYSGNYGGYFKNVNVTELKYFRVSKTSLDFGTNFVGDAETQSFTFEHANAADVTTITAPEHFSVSLDGLSFAESVVLNETGVDLYGDATIYVRYNTSDENSCTNSVLTVSDGTNTKEILLSGSTSKYDTEVTLAPTIGDVYVGLDPANVAFVGGTVRTTNTHDEVTGSFRVTAPDAFAEETASLALTITFVPDLDNKYNGCSFTAPVEVARRRVLFDGGGSTDAWTNEDNWVIDALPTIVDDVEIADDVEISEDVTIHGITIDADATLTIKAGYTLTIGDGNSGTLAEYGNLVVEAGAALQLGAGVLEVNDITIYSKLGDLEHAASSANISNQANLNVNGDAYIVIQLDPSGVASYGWYAFTVPFEVDLKEGVFFGATKLTNESDYAIMQYRGDVRATGAYGWIKSYKVDKFLHPGVFYLIAVGDTDYATLRFKKTTDSPLDNTETSVVLQEFAASGDGSISDAGWNGLGNPSLSYQNIDFGGDKVQVYYHASNSFDVLTTADHSFVVGSPFFAKATSASDILTFTIPTDAALGLLRAPSRMVASAELNVRLGRNIDSYVDQLYLSASNEALSTYEEGHDLVKATMGTANVAQMTISAYGMELCDAELPWQAGEATFPLSLTAPTAGEYQLYLNDGPADQTLYLMQNGVVVWNLSTAPYTLSLTKGANVGYSLLLRQNAPAVTTEFDNLNNAAKAEKVVVDGHLYILKEDKTYDAVGRLVR